MSVQTLYTAATGMESLQTKLDVIANNLANINTTSFKKDRANFEDLFYRQELLPGAEDASGERSAVGLHVGLGSRVSSVQSDFRQGSFAQTGSKLDVAIEGDGFFQVLDPSGEFRYTRAGNFSINANNQLVIGSAQTGRVLDPPITFPGEPDANQITISPGGIVSISTLRGLAGDASPCRTAMVSAPRPCRAGRARSPARRSAAPQRSP